jgi:hypothetical protein
MSEIVCGKIINPLDDIISPKIGCLLESEQYFSIVDKPPPIPKGYMAGS